MENVNFYRRMEQQLAAIPPGTPLLLHACCAPCSSAVLERLARHFDITMYFYNPNIWPEQEYRRRRGELERLVPLMGLDARVAFADAPWDQTAFETAARGLEAEPEGGARCTACFKLRLGRAAQTAAERGIPWFTTTLTVGPRKNAALLNQLGEQAAQAHGVSFLNSDFKKRDGYRRSIELSGQYGVYRQQYCGCRYSLGDGEGAGRGEGKQTICRE